MSALKFTDRDVRERPELVAEAVRYLRWYQGEFEFLQDAKHFEASNGYLPLSTARGVLNCMRNDMRYALVADGLPTPFDYTPSPVEGLKLEQQRRQLRLIREEESREPFPLKTYWNARLYYSGHKGAEVVHALRLDSPIWYYPASRDRKFWVRGGLRGVCSQNFTSGNERLARELPEGKRFCRRCVEHIAEFGYDWGPTTKPPVLELL